jgi:hypothetical protein
MATMKLDESHVHAAVAADDLTGKLHYLGNLNAAGEIKVAGAGEVVIGHIYEEAAEGYPATLATGDHGKCIAAAAINAGVLLQSDADGKAAAGSTNAFGISLTATGGANEIIEYKRV